MYFIICIFSCIFGSNQPVESHCFNLYISLHFDMLKIIFFTLQKVAQLNWTINNKYLPHCMFTLHLHLAKWPIWKSSLHFTRMHTSRITEWWILNIKCSSISRILKWNICMTVTYSILFMGKWMWSKVVDYLHIFACGSTSHGWQWLWMWPCLLTLFANGLFVSVYFMTCRGKLNAFLLVLPFLTICYFLYCTLVVINSIFTCTFHGTHWIEFLSIVLSQSTCNKRNQKCCSAHELLHFI